MNNGFVELNKNQCYLEYFSRNNWLSHWQLPTPTGSSEAWITRGKVGSRMLENLAVSEESQLSPLEINRQFSSVTTLIRNPIERFISAYWYHFCNRYKDMVAYRHLFFQKSNVDEFFKLNAESDIIDHNNNFKNFVYNQLQSNSLFDSFGLPIIVDTEKYHFLNYLPSLFSITIPMRIIHLYHMPREAAKAVGLFPDKYKIFQQVFRLTSEYEKMLVYLNDEIVAYNILSKYTYDIQPNEYSHFVKKIIKQRAEENKKNA